MKTQWSILIMLFTLLSQSDVFAQASSFYIQPSVDTAYVGEVISLEFTMSNMDGEISNPFWHDSFEIIGNVGTFSQTTFMNNEMKSKRGYTLQIRPTLAGVFPIEGICTTAEGEELHTILKLYVKDGLRVDEKADEQFQRIPPFEERKSNPNKKKRKIYRL